MEEKDEFIEEIFEKDWIVKMEPKTKKKLICKSVKSEEFERFEKKANDLIILKYIKKLLRKKITDEEIKKIYDEVIFSLFKIDDNVIKMTIMQALFSPIEGSIRYIEEDLE